jgi:hypothetical protein
MLAIGRDMGLISKTLIIGASGFLGRTVVQDILDQSPEPQHVYRTVRVNDQISIASLAPNIKHQETLEEFFATPNCKFEIVNCASVRYPREKIHSQIGNFEMPKLILESAIRHSSQVIKWIQPESFWQYTLDKTPDPEYVRWKDSLGIILEELSFLSKIQHQRVVLPHLFGVNDDVNRFFPKLFGKLLNETTVSISGGAEIFAIADVADVSGYFVELLAGNAFGFQHNLVVFPYHQITLRNLVDEFLAGSRSNPTIIWENSSLTTNPRMKLGQNFPGIQLNISITPIQTSLTNIQSWLKQNMD